MFSFRRKPQKVEEEPKIRVSPSLPELNTSHGLIPWPANLVDVSSIGQPPAEGPPHQGAAKTYFQAMETPIPFHKPFRPSIGKTAEGVPISSLYMSNGTPMFEPVKSVQSPSINGKYSQRRAKTPPTFNLMVVGGQGTGKTSLLRLLLQTADLSPTATLDQKAALDNFLRGKPKATTGIETACVEICESRFDRILFSVIDTPGLDYMEGRELKLERQVSNIIKYVDAQYADTMNEESKVVRKSKGDQHIHLCIYLIDPSSVMTVAARRAQSSLPIKTRSEATVSARSPPDLVSDTSSGDDSDEEQDAPLTMSPAELRVIRRLSKRMNVLPVIAKTDSLTDETLLAVKDSVRTGLANAGLDFGVFGPSSTEKKGPPRPRTAHFSDDSHRNGAENGHTNQNGDTQDSDIEGEGAGEEERQSRPIIKLRPTRTSRNLSRSRSRRDLSLAAEDERRPVSPDINDTDSIANVRFSAAVVAKKDLSSLMPFAVISPEPANNMRMRRSVSPSSPLAQSDEGHQPSIDAIPPTPQSSFSMRTLSYLQGPPEDLRGVFVRKFRWGTIDVLDPAHCDFAALRTAVLSTHLKVLKNQTKEVLYEKYRTEKLLARRATSQITDEERQQLLKDLGL